MLTQGYVINVYNKVSVQFYNVLWYYNYILRLGRNEQISPAQTAKQYTKSSPFVMSDTHDCDTHLLLYSCQYTPLLYMI